MMFCKDSRYSLSFAVILFLFNNLVLLWIELEKKLAEQKKYDQDLKRKSRHLDNVMLLTPNEKRQKRNIIRIGRQKAVESRIPPGKK